MRQNLKQGKVRSINNSPWVLNESMAHSFSESEPLKHKGGISTNCGNAPDNIHIFLRSNNVNYGGILTTDGKIIPILTHVYTKKGALATQLASFSNKDDSLTLRWAEILRKNCTLLSNDWFSRSVIKNTGYQMVDLQLLVNIQLLILNVINLSASNDVNMAFQGYVEERN